MDEISEQEENDADERFSRGERAAHLTALKYHTARTGLSR